MTREKPSTTVFMEGASRSGKTTILKSLETPQLSIIYKDWPDELINPPIAFFLERDEDKLSRARKSMMDLKLVDRGYLSTMVFYSVLEEQRGISSLPVYKWFINEIGKKLYRPDYYIFVDVPPEITVDRYNKNGGLVYENNMWVKYPERIEYWYSRLLTAFESSTPTYHINGDRDLTIVMKEFKELVDEIRTKPLINQVAI